MLQAEGVPARERWCGVRSPGCGAPASALLGAWGGLERLSFSPSLSRLGLILLLLQYCTEFLFHMARLFYFADENNEKL